VARLGDQGGPAVGAGRARAVLKVKFMCDFAAEVIRKEYPEVVEKVSIRTCILNWGTRVLERI
jgi:hypothetical protein